MDAFEIAGADDLEVHRERARQMVGRRAYVEKLCREEAIECEVSALVEVLVEGHQFRTIDRELAAYGSGLETRPQVIVLNKLDLLPEEPTFELADERVQRVFGLSCATGAGVDEFRRALFGLLPEADKRPSEDDALADFLVYRPRPSARPFKILKTDRGFRVTGRAPAGDELEEALRAAGAKSGDEVELGNEVLEFQ